MQYFFDNQTNNRTEAQAMIFGSLVKIWGKTIESKLGFKSTKSHGLGSTLLLKIVALQLMTHQFSCPMSFLRLS
jgi:hypothetical protein